MASLRNIMNLDDHADSLSLKKPSESVSSFTQHPESALSTASYATRPDLSISSSSPSSSARPQTQSSPSRLAVEAPAPSFPPGHPSDNAAPGRHESVTSTDSMDSSYGASFTQAYTHGHPGAPYPAAPIRPFVPAGDAPVKLTPITGRVSRAKKGLAVHICELCRPPKTFTRAEHLRRHQLSHQPPDLQCQVPGCDKVFHRKDLLERHQQRHDQDERHAGSARRRSLSRSNGPMSPLQGHYSGQPSDSPLQMPPTYTSPPPVSSPTSGVSTRGMPMAPGPWSSPSNSTPRLRDTQHFAMRGVKAEYPLESLSSLESIPFRVPPAFSGSRSRHGLGLMDVPDLCMSAAGSEPLAVSWTDSSGLVSSGSGSPYSTPPPSDASHGPRSVPRSSSAEWGGPLGPQLVARDMHSPAMGTGDYPPPFGYSTSPSQVYPSIYGEANGLAFPRYADSLYSSPVPSAMGRSLSPQMAGGQYSETLITAPAALSADRVVSLGTCGFRPEAACGLLTAQDFMPVSLSREALSLMPTYLDLYWDKVHPNYPIIHRATFEDASGVEAEHLDVLRCAMAAVATQFLGHRDNRINGSQLHAYAWQVSKAFTQSTNWSLPIMQAVLLCEYYARFRGRSKEAYRPSPRFNTLCQMVAAQNIWETGAASNFSLRGWRDWVRVESCRRLLAACFLLSVHGNWYYEQPFTADLGLDNFSPVMLSIPLSANSTQAWEAESVELWAAVDVTAIRVQTVGDLLQQKQTLTPCSIESMPSFDASLLLAAHALQLPRRPRHTEVDVLEDASSLDTDKLSIVRLFPHSPGAYVYLALHHTPLHWLLSVSGDSWVFNKKVSRARSFMEHQRKLDKWRNSGSAAVATLFAAKALKIFLCLEPSALGTDAARRDRHRKTLPWTDISDFWGLYVCSLICWAFGHAGKPNANKSSRGAAAQWIVRAADLQPGQLQALAGREDTQGVVGLARDVLERDCLGGRSILYADAVGVLRKLEEGDSWKRF